MQSLGALLLVEQDERWRASITRALRQSVVVVPAETTAVGRAWLHAFPWRALVVDAPAGARDDALDLLGEARASGILAPVLLISDRCEKGLVRRAFRLDASYLCKPFHPREVARFLSSNRHDAHGGPRGEDLKQSVRILSARHGLSRREEELVAASVCGVPRREFVANRGITMNTYKTEVRHALKKLGARSLGTVRDALLRETARAAT